jgi:hypothetical protein
MLGGKTLKGALRSSFVKRGRTKMSEEDDVAKEVSLFKSIWGILTIILAIVGLGVSVMSFVFKTFPTNSDLEEKAKTFITKQEYFQQEPFNKKVISIEESFKKFKEEALKKDEENKKAFEKELTKARIEAKTERLHLMTMLINIVDRKLVEHPGDKSLTDFRDELCREYNRVRAKLDNNLKELE